MLTGDETLTCRRENLNIISPEITGRGHYVGTILLSQGHETGSTWFFEGDDKTYINGELAIHKTRGKDLHLVRMNKWENC
ncbi:MAG: DUF2961 domain-containing protein [Bacteroidales bacterium]|nr:DUF2961 domain-containing protein [Bacteroidales bacterium]HQK70112.1 DUF2961 domain-containing protein [Bacteroidales bacterium]